MAAIFAFKQSGKVPRKVLKKPLFLEPEIKSATQMPSR